MTIRREGGKPLWESITSVSVTRLSNTGDHIFRVYIHMPYFHLKTYHALHGFLRYFKVKRKTDRKTRNGGNFK